MHNDPSQRSVLGAYNAGAILVRRESGYAADEPRVERGAVRAHHAHAHAHGPSAGAGDAPPATRALPRITRPALRTRTAPSATSSS